MCQSIQVKSSLSSVKVTVVLWSVADTPSLTPRKNAGPDLGKGKEQEKRGREEEGERRKERNRHIPYIMQIYEIY